ncbi:mitofusin-1-like isoform X3 [Mya arenaria]|uniref:mitofusin-1-like isoform X3 n=1 Tax=Mya arenaria TaxID=6604 RepID=UPI0022E41454|nr:mitofusin-1-like isoform X3 [Mya arenaria]XP_052759813.1 mitofusin-1-like isoform X3 [Mya arenaria]
MSGSVYTPMENPDHRGSGDAGVGHRSIGHGRNGNGRMSPNSPLKRFGQAKKTINDIFRDVLDFIKEADNFVEGIATGGYLEGVSCQDQVKEYREKVCGIMEVLARDHMKVVFFGRTSNGKSTTINAMLREKILPTGIGHTTNCFLQVEGSDSTEGYLLTEEEPEKPKSVHSIKQLASALSNVKLKENSLIRILWPKSKCRLLREEVVLVDSPGIDVTPDLDLWIDKFCLDADVFVLVSNAESTLMQTEKNFFHKVSARLSKPNIFILQNRWDISAFEDDVDEVKQQHLERNLQFLCSELNVMDKREGEERVFFVSSREALASRLKEQGTPTPTGILQEGFQERLFTFANFERVFEECISKTAVKTKFEQHTNRGKNITTELRSLMEKMLRTSQEQNERVNKERREMADELDYMEKQLTLLTTEIKDKIKNMVEDVENKVAMTLKDEIRRLAILVDEFDRPFHTDQTSLDIYKQELHEHIENGLGRNVQSRCSATLQSALETTQHEMTERLSALLPEEAQQQINTVMPRRDFEIAYRLDCRRLCEDFEEDIAFRFTLAPRNILRWMFGRRGIPAPSKHFDAVPRNIPMTPQEPRTFREADPDNAEVLVNLVSIAGNIGQKTALGGLIVCGVIYKAVGWKVLAVGVLGYGGFYCFERMRWTSKAKERAFKAQYVDYASSKLKLIVDLTSSNCSHQVQQELTSTFARLCNEADITKQKLEDEIKQQDIVISQLGVISAKSKTYRNKADWLDKALDNFKEQFLIALTSGV